MPDLNISIVEGSAVGNPDAKVSPAELARIAGTIKRVVKQMAPDANLELVDQVFSPDSEVSGRYQEARALISVALKAGNPLEAVRHEIIHFLKDAGVIGKPEWALLETQARRVWMRQYDIEALYPGLDRKAQLEEAIAQAFAEWQGAKGKHAPRFRRLFARIRDFLVDLGARLRRRAGYRTPEDGAGRLERLPPHRHRR